jgi:hypothetical protein
MWTPTTRQQHSRPVTRYQTDLTDAEWHRDRAAPAEALRNRPAACLADARDRQRHLLCHAGWLPVAAASKIAMAADRYCTRRAASSRSSSECSPTADMPVRGRRATLIAVEIVRNRSCFMTFETDPEAGR